MIDDHCAPPSFGRHAFTGHVHDVWVNIRQVAERNIAQAVTGQHGSLARKIFERAAGSEMNHGIGLLLNPEISSQPLVRGRDFRIMQNPADFAVATGAVTPAFRLRHNKHVSKPQSGNEQCVITTLFPDHTISRKLSPVIVDFFSHRCVERVESYRVLPAGHGVQYASLADNFIDGRPAELLKSLAFLDHVKQCFSILRNSADMIPFRLHSPEKPHEALERIEPGRHTDRAFDTLAGIVVQNNGNALLAVREPS